MAREMQRNVGLQMLRSACRASSPNAYTTFCRRAGARARPFTLDVIPITIRFDLSILDNIAIDMRATRFSSFSVVYDEELCNQCCVRTSVYVSAIVVWSHSTGSTSGVTLELSSLMQVQMQK